MNDIVNKIENKSRRESTHSATFNKVNDAKIESSSEIKEAKVIENQITRRQSSSSLIIKQNNNEIEIENKPYTEAVQINIEINSDEQIETYNKKYLNVMIFFSLEKRSLKHE